MRRPFAQTNLYKFDQTNQSNLEFLLISGSLIGINFGLMIFVGMYWLNPAFHTFLTGKPL